MHLAVSSMLPHKARSIVLALQVRLVIIGRCKVGPANYSMYMTRDVAGTHDGVKASSSKRTVRNDPESVISYAQDVERETFTRLLQIELGRLRPIPT